MPWACCFRRTSKRTSKRERQHGCRSDVGHAEAAKKINVFGFLSHHVFGFLSHHLTDTSVSSRSSVTESWSSPSSHAHRIEKYHDHRPRATTRMSPLRRSMRRIRPRAATSTRMLVFMSSVLAAVFVDASTGPADHTGVKSSHEITRATNVTPGDDTRHPASLQLTVHAFGASLDLDLERNDELFSREYRVLAWNPASNAHQLVGNHPGTDHCHYHGRVRNANPGVRSHVVLSTCHGLSGIVKIGDETITLKPAERDAEHRDDDQLDADVVATIDVNADGSVGPIPVGEDLSESAPSDSRRALLGGGGGADAFKYTAGPQTIVMRVMVVNDNDRCKFFTAGASMTSAEQTNMEVHTRHLMNMAAWMYKTISDEVSIRIVLAGQVNWCAGNAFSMKEVQLGDRSGTYDDKVKYYQSFGARIIDKSDLDAKVPAWIYSNQASLPPFDVAHIFSPNAFAREEGALSALAGGFASQGTPCYGFGVDGDIGRFGSSDQFAVHVIAHELGHNFGLNHDIGPGCHESDIFHIMTGDGSDSTDGKISVRVWSKCSVDAMLKLVQDSKLDCLKGPGHQSTTGRCGNGIIDPGEGCDCGALDCSSVDACCDGTTCQLATGATCAPTEIGAGGTRASKHPVPAVTRRPAHPPRREPCAVLPLTRPAMRPRFATVPPLRVPPTRPRSRSGLLALESTGIVDRAGGNSDSGGLSAAQIEIYRAPHSPTLYCTGTAGPILHAAVPTPPTVRARSVITGKETAFLMTPRRKSSPRRTATEEGLETWFVFPAPTVLLVGILYNGHTLWQVSRVVTSVQTASTRACVTAEPDTIGTDTWLRTSRMASCTTDLTNHSGIRPSACRHRHCLSPLPRRLLPHRPRCRRPRPRSRRRRHLRRRHFSSTSQILITPTQKTDGIGYGTSRLPWLERFRNRTRSAIRPTGIRRRGGHARRFP